MELTRSEQAWELVQSIRVAQNKVCEQFMVIGQALVEIRDRGLHGDWAQHCVTFDDFLRDIGIRKSSAYNAIRVYKQFGHLNTKGIPMDRLVRLTPLNLPEESKEEWLEKARELPAQGLRDEILEAKGHQPLDLCEHDRQIQQWKCPDCGLSSDRPLS